MREAFLSCLFVVYQFKLPLAGPFLPRINEEDLDVVRRQFGLPLVLGAGLGGEELDRLAEDLETKVDLGKCVFKGAGIISFLAF